MASVEKRINKDGSKSYKVYWSLPKSLIPAGQKKGTGSLTVYTVDDAEKALEFAEQHRHRILGEQVEELLAEWKRAQDPETSSVMTLAKWFEIWIGSIDRSNLSERQVETYSSQFQNVFLPELGSRPLADIEPIDIQTVYRKLGDKGRKAKTIQTYHAAIHACLNVAARSPKRSGISHNPATGLKPGDSAETDEDREPEHFFERGQYSLIVESVKPDTRLFVRFLGETGIRFSEATALQVRDLNFQSNVAEIGRAHKRSYSGAVLKKTGQPKGKSDRWVEVTPTVMREVALHVERLGLRDKDTLFRAPRGGAIHHSNFVNRRWLPMMRRLTWCPTHMPMDLKLPSSCRCLGNVTWTAFRPHALRHTWATWAILAGQPISFVSRQLGHPDTAFTEKTYVHLLKSRPLGMGEAIDRYLGRVA